MAPDILLLNLGPRVFSTSCLMVGKLGFSTESKLVLYDNLDFLRTISNALAFLRMLANVQKIREKKDFEGNKSDS